MIVRRKIMYVLVLLFLLVAALASGQTQDHLSSDEIKTAASTPLGTGFLWLQDGDFTTPTLCQAQMPALFIYTPTAWLSTLSVNARKQYRQFEPTPEDTLRALTIISHGCANGTPAGPVCDSITRVVLISDTAGSKVAEAVESHPVSQSWQNGFGASAACSSLVSRFLLTDVERVRNSKGEFFVATFDGPTRLKVYTVKQKHLKKLGM
jgi:hypothetical protein